MATYVDELVADHVEWIVPQGGRGHPRGDPRRWRPTSSRPRFASGFCTPAASATTATWRTSAPRANAQQFRQIDLWMRRAAQLPFTGLASERVRTQALFRAAAAFCAGQAANPTALPEPDGTHPLPRHFQSKRLAASGHSPRPPGSSPPRRRLFLAIAEQRCACKSRRCSSVWTGTGSGLNAYTRGGRQGLPAARCVPAARPHRASKRTGSCAVPERPPAEGAGAPVPEAAARHWPRL